LAVSFHPVSTHRNAGIDLLRGVAIFLVICHHIGIRLPLAKGMMGQFMPQWLMTLLNFRGYQAVFIFFVISGFLIARNSIHRWERLSKIRPAAFYLRRAARILPCLLVLLSVLSVLHLCGLPDYTISHSGQTLPRALFSALTLHLNWYEGLTGYLPANWDVLWSLSIEECFYLAFPLLCLLLRRDWLLAPVMAAFALMLPYFLATTTGSEIWQEKAYLPGMSAIALGVLGAMITRWIHPPNRWFVLSLFAFGGMSLLAALCCTRLLWPKLHEGTMLLLTLATLSLLLAFHWQAQSGKPWLFGGTGWLQSGGRMSYEIYLSHMFIVLPAARFFGAHTSGQWWNFSVYLVSLPLCWLLGWLITRLLSTPTDHWLLRRFTRRTSTPQAITLSA